MSAFYIILVALVIGYLLWRGRGRRPRRLLSPAELGEVLERSRQHRRVDDPSVRPSDTDGEEPAGQSAGD